MALVNFRLPQFEDCASRGCGDGDLSRRDSPPHSFVEVSVRQPPEEILPEHLTTQGKPACVAHGLHKLDAGLRGLGGPDGGEDPGDPRLDSREAPVCLFEVVGVQAREVAPGGRDHHCELVHVGLLARGVALEIVGGALEAVPMEVVVALAPGVGGRSYLHRPGVVGDLLKVHDQALALDRVGRSTLNRLREVSGALSLAVSVKENDAGQEPPSHKIRWKVTL